MKKNILLLFIIVLCLTSFISAQSEFTLGPTIGINFTSYNGKDANQLGNLSSKTGLYIGGFFNYHFAEMFALQPELAFTMKGADATMSSEGYNFNLTYTDNYIEIPVLLKFYIPIEGARTIKPELFAGPVFGFNVAANYEISSTNFNQTSDASSTTKGFDFGLAFGGGVGFLVGTGVLDFSLRYTYGLSSIDNSGANLSVTNGAFSIIANYGFSL
jgi:hypothetical protein